MSNENEYYQVSLKVIMKNSKNEILCLSTPETGSFRGLYDMPGGRIDKKEFDVPFHEIISRELSEEIGSDIEYELNDTPVALARHLLPARLADGSDIPVIYIFFSATYLSGNIQISHEHERYAWLDLEAIKLEGYFTSGILDGIKTYIKNN